MQKNVLQKVTAKFSTLLDERRDEQRKIQVDKDALRPELLSANYKRLWMLSLIGSLIAFSYGLKFFLTPSEGIAAAVFWRRGILLTHLSLLVCMLLLFLVTSIYKKRDPMPSAGVQSFLQYTAVAALLASGLALTIIDQLVTSNMTPFLITTLLVSLLLRIRPIVIVPILIVDYLIFHLTLGIYQKDSATILSNQLNGIIVTIMSIVLTLIMWQNSTRNILQTRYIEQQKAELEEKNSRLEQLVSYDSLTGLFNRREFDRILEHELNRINRIEQPLTLILLDLDHFKAFNDLYGHVKGDDCLKEVSAAILSLVRRTGDAAVRYGGEEFAVILPQSSPEYAETLAERIRTTILDLEIPHPGNPAAPVVSISSGVFTILPPSHLTPLQTLEKVDALLYRAKHEGRNRWISALEWSEAVSYGIYQQFTWNPAWISGISSIDQQHRQMLNMANELIKCLHDPENSTACRDLFAKILETFKQHCEDEEKILAGLHYTDLAPHAVLHRRLIEHGTSILRNWAPDYHAKNFSIVYYLILDLVVEHMEHADRAYFPLTRARVSTV